MCVCVCLTHSLEHEHSDLNIESLYEYGSRVGYWRIAELFVSSHLPLTVFAVGKALELSPEIAAHMKQQQRFDVASHGYRWIDYSKVDIATERAHIRQSIQVHRNLFGSAPTGWYQGKVSANTRQLLKEEAVPHGLLYDSDNYSDDLPFFLDSDSSSSSSRDYLIVPYTLDVNDWKFVSMNGFNTGDEYFRYVKDAVDVLVAEAARTGVMRMLSVGLVHPNNRSCNKRDPQWAVGSIAASSAGPRGLPA